MRGTDLEDIADETVSGDEFADIGEAPGVAAGVVSWSPTRCQ
jgi:hypothetical protein